MKNNNYEPNLTQAYLFDRENLKYDFKKTIEDSQATPKIKEIMRQGLENLMKSPSFNSTDIPELRKDNLEKYSQRYRKK